ncbi:pyridoxamine 5'-phosphate oxidase family protein [Amycolatopsis sp. H20-H5]|uniref:pyridoxamine 5'-phosphate oxidase family protein n=1 Tax=Amycolatopsis sp. H20-H5 TaxID=3046309 RepID=UPI002DB779B1|nr:pyridoxamine 5'-phosphate oxidase family protein [Amycolatopsis sp. H20-H5]MEC3975880.1 pyridoxamine 5'-phosphate oxidase family protein [Amycolatopsis sp. H20-H5]
MTTPADAELEQGLRLVRQFGSTERWLAVLVTQRRDGSPAVSVVNAGVLIHPVTGAQTVALVARGATAKLANLRHTPRATLVFRAGWEWVAVSGPVELAGPDDHLAGLPARTLPGLLRDIFHAAGGVHEDLDAYDAAMATERRVAILLHPQHFSTNPAGTEHQEPG